MAKNQSIQIVQPVEATPSSSFGVAAIPVALAILLVLRPWRDGLTYAGFNTYFIWVAFCRCFFN